MFSQDSNRKNWQFGKDYDNDTRTLKEYTDSRFQEFKNIINEENEKLAKWKNGTCTNVVKIQDIFQFSINKDDSFQIDKVQYEIIWEDGIKSTTSVNSISRLKFAYQNGIDKSFIQNNKNKALENSKTICRMYMRAK
jgi:hypothetical protein